MTTDIFIIVVTYNGMQWIEQCLESTAGYKVVVVDNNSTDGTVKFIKERYPKVTILEQKKNFGFGQANNLGIRYALDRSAKAVFLLNQDAYLEKNTIGVLSEISHDNPDYGILSPIHLNGKGDQLDLNFSRYLSQSINNSFYSDHILNKALSSIYEVPFVNAAGWFVTENCIKTVGGFDPIFFHYGEDDNYCQRLRYHGLKIGVIPRIFIRHDRENRSSENMDNGTFSYEKIKKSLKLNFADINKPLGNELEMKIRRRKTAMIKSYLKLKFKTAKSYQAEYQLHKKLLPEIVTSRSINVKRGLHYL
ncbi:MAG: glycosyltransferase family 2 protein [Leeuwenhoekiella sp.]